jgi:hypothetical protein
VQVAAPATTEPTTTETFPTPSPVATVRARPQEPGGKRDYFLVRGTYLNAHYNELSAELVNGAHSLGIGYARPYDWLEGRLQIEAGIGMDHEIAVQNVRYFLAHADAVFFFSSGFIRPFTSLGLGFGSFYVRSQRVNTNGRDVLYREHTQGAAFIATPAAGARFAFGSFAIDTSLEYLVVAGAGSGSALGGWVGALTLGMPF